MKCLCGKQPFFGLLGERPTRCADCKTTEMVNVKSRLCPCGKHINFGLPGERPSCCAKCKTSGMVNVISKHCLCGKQPSYGLPGKRPLCCKECRTDEMVNVVSKKCPCGKRPSFGLPGKRPMCCKDCKKDGMEDVQNRKCPCGKQPAYGLPGERPTCCEGCKTTNMINVVSKTCPGYNNESCPVMAQLQYGNTYCSSCDPDYTIRKKRKVDEEAFFDFLNKNNVGITQREFRIDYKCIDTGKTRSEIDGIIVTPTIFVCIELDEEAHAHYDPVCEQTRMNDATTELRLEYPDHCIAWVRINPNILNKNSKRDRTSKGRKVRDKRHQEALGIIKELIAEPLDCVKYIGY